MRSAWPRMMRTPCLLPAAPCHGGPSPISTRAGFALEPSGQHHFRPAALFCEPLPLHLDTGQVLLRIHPPVYVTNDMDEDATVVAVAAAMAGKREGEEQAVAWRRGSNTPVCCARPLPAQGGRASAVRRCCRRRRVRRRRRWREASLACPRGVSPPLACLVLTEGGEGGIPRPLEGRPSAGPSQLPGKGGRRQRGRREEGLPCLLAGHPWTPCAAATGALPLTWAARSGVRILRTWAPRAREGVGGRPFTGGSRWERPPWSTWRRSGRPRGEGLCSLEVSSVASCTRYSTYAGRTCEWSATQGAAEVAGRRAVRGS